MRAYIIVLVTLGTINSFSHGICYIARGSTLPTSYTCKIDIGKLVWQGDGNLVIYDGNNKALWNTETHGRGDRAIFQSDGNFVIYNIANQAVWNSGTVGIGITLVFQDDRNFVMYNNANIPVWYTSTN